MPLPRRRWVDMTTEDFADPDVGSWIAVLPVAAVEQHGPHLPVGVDAMIGEGYLERALALVPAELPVTVLPMQTVGASSEHSSFPGTLSLSPETVIRAWTEIGGSLARAGLRKLVFANSHGGNSAALDVVARALRVSHGMLAVATSWPRLGYPADLFTHMELRHGIHGGEIETSLMLSFRPELVRMDKARDFTPATYDMERDYAQLRAGSPAGFGWMSQDLNPSGAIGDAASATKESGEAAAEFGARAFVELLHDVHRFPIERLAKGPLDD
ncbi:creatininase family protein [Hansschlegelia plantiphila]|uniref:Creatininase n=1 Tax=Hansschlegelia plantiphila TaxID=374655 RepID=A0A9W6MVW5_9HYPH|nr:creatininase family protein [Hansschlegelia plantiphila]GLK68351.1 creatininase [Hansschlegelia plantiphila]